MMTFDTVALAFGVTPVPMLLADGEGLVRLTNAEFDSLFGYEAGALVGQPVEVLLPRAMKEAHVGLREAFAVLPAKRRMGAGRTVAGVTRSGEALPLELALEPVTVDGTSMTIVTAVDARAQLRNRARIRAIMDAASCTMLVVDEEGRIEFVNQAVEALVGYRPEDLLGQTVEVLIPEQLRTAHRVYRRSFSSLGEGRAMARGRMVSALHRDGHAVAVEGVLNRVEVDGAPRVVVTLVDLTERVAAEQAMSARALELERLNADLWEFSRSISHDLKAPLVSVSGLLTLCVEDLEAGEHGELAATLARAKEIAENSAAEIEEVLRLTLAPGVEGPQVGVALRDMVAELWEHLAAGLSGVQLRPTVPSDLTLMTEAPVLRSILRNLLSNAIQFRDMSKPELEVRIGAREAGDHLELMIIDNGIGIPADFLPHIFDLFARRGDRGGSGVGLNLARRNVERLGGEIAVSSELGQGTEFIVSLPLNQEQVK